MEGKMNIAIIDMDSIKNPFWGAGAAHATREVGKRLAKKHQVTVYCSKYPGFKNYREDGINYEHIGIVSNNPHITNLFFLLSIPILVRNLKADLIVENFHAPTSISFAPLFTKTPIVGLPAMFNAKEFTKKYYLPFDLVERFGIKFYKYLLPYSEIDSTKAKKLNPKISFKIVPQGVDKSFFKIKYKKPKHILFLSRFDIWQKGIDLLIKAYAKVSDKISYPLIIAGHGPDKEKIIKLVRELDLKNKVKILGPAYGARKTKLIEESIFVAFPSRHDEISLWALEALAAGLPIVAFDIPESRWIKDSVSLKAKPFNLDDYAEKMLEAVKPEINKKMRKNAREFAKGFTWENVANQFEDFFKYVLKAEKRHA